MALGVNRDYKTADRRARKLLAIHNEIMNSLMKNGMDREAASNEAMKCIEDRSKMKAYLDKRDGD